MEASKTNSSNGVFINGKGQIIEMLQMMNSQERNLLLAKVRIKNPQLADELSEQCFSFSDLNNLTDHELSQIFNYIGAQVLGMALKNIDVQFQRRLLSLPQRAYAEEAFRVLKTSYKNEKKDCARAQSKIIETLIAIRRDKRSR